MTQAMDAQGRSFHQDRNDVEILNIQNLNKRITILEDRLESIEQLITYYEHTYKKDAFLNSTRRLRADRDMLVRTLSNVEDILEEYDEYANMSYMYNDPEHRVNKIWRLTKVILILDKVPEEEE